MLYLFSYTVYLIIDSKNYINISVEYNVFCFFLLIILEIFIMYLLYNLFGTYLHVYFNALYIPIYHKHLREFYKPKELAMLIQYGILFRYYIILLPFL